MAEYIEREALVAEIEKAQSSLESNIDKVWYRNKPYFKGLAWANRLTRDAPTADVVEVVRCKDCKHWKNGYCWGVPLVGDDASYVATEETDYCSYGEAKMDGKGEK